MDGRSVAKQLRGAAPAVGNHRPSNVAYLEYHGLGPVGAPRRLLDSFNNTFRGVRLVGGSATEEGDNDLPSALRLFSTVNIPDSLRQNGHHTGATDIQEYILSDLNTDMTNSGQNRTRSVAGAYTPNVLFAEWGGDYEYRSVVFRELYDLDQDPWQMHNLYYQYNRQHPEFVRALENMTRALYRCAGGDCV